MRGNNKAVLERAKRHILSFYAGNGGRKGMIANGNSAGGATDYHKGVRLVEGGDFLISYYDQRKALSKIYGTPKAQADKYSDDKVWQQYKHICGRAYEAIAKEKPKKRRKKAVGHKKAKNGGCVGFLI